MMDYKTILASVAASVATVAISVPAAVNFVTLQASSPGTADSGHINVTGNVIGGRVGVNDTPGLARLQVKETGGLQGVRSISGTGVAVYGQSNATSGLGAGGYFTSASAGGRAVVGEQMSTTGNTVGGIFFTHSNDGIGLWGRHNGTSGTAAGIQGDTSSTSSSAVAIQGTVNSTNPGGFSTAVRGTNNGAGGLGIGVWGSQAGSGWGVYGTATSGVGVNASSNSGIAVNGSSSSGIAGSFSSGTKSVQLAGTNGSVFAKGDGIYNEYSLGNRTPCIPVAWGSIAVTGGTIFNSGSGNWTVTKESTGTVSIDIAGVSWAEANYVYTASTNSGSGSPRIVTRINTISGDLTLRTIDLTNDSPVDGTGIHFVIYANNFPPLSGPLPLATKRDSFDSTTNFDRDPRAKAWLQKKLDEQRKLSQVSSTASESNQGVSSKSNP